MPRFFGHGFFRRRFGWMLGGISLALLLGASVAIGAPLTQDVTNSAPNSIWGMLAPLLIAAVGVERAVEIIWNYLEWMLLGVGKWPAAQLKSAPYLQFKSGTSLITGIILGILIANATGMHLFGSLKPFSPDVLAGMPAAWDVLMTGFLIGVGAKPVHDLLGILTQFKNFLGSSAIRQREAAGAALAEGVLKLAQSDAQAMVDVPGIGPARMPSTAGAHSFDSDGATTVERSSSEKYIELLHKRTSL
ncbi:MAG: hypothetical protein NT075_06760 [Chloroflexi bacterium]|nr:hypothetical protein [Chloroflexota bacterium]